MDPITAAIRELRKQCGDSQEIFAERLHISPRALAFYESGERKPTLPGMVAMMKTADSMDRTELGHVFQRAIEKELGHAIMRFTPSKTVELAEGEQEDIDAVLAILRLKGKPYTELRARLKELIAPAAAANRAKDYRAALHGGLLLTIQKRMAAGDTDEEILAALPEANPDLVKVLLQNQRELARLTKGGN